jgi:5-methylcytosine-specific restriction endonuclease McrA
MPFAATDDLPNHSMQRTALRAAADAGRSGEHPRSLTRLFFLLSVLGLLLVMAIGCTSSAGAEAIPTVAPALPQTPEEQAIYEQCAQRELPYCDELKSGEDMPIRRHVKVRKNANPYDPAWEIYFERRQYNKVLDDLQDRPRLRHQWRQQRGLCPVCRERITKETGWHNHPIQWRVYGGGDELENRVLLHPNCHPQVHSPDYLGPPLRPFAGVRDA